MSRIIITGDIHNGLTGKLDDCIWAMEVIRQYALQNEIKNIIICGDLFHDRVSLTIDTLSRVYDQLGKNIESEQVWYCLCGNHDMYLKNSWQFNSLHTFGDVINRFEDISDFYIDDTHFHILPFIHYESKYMEALAQLETKYKAGDILLTHIGVCGATLNECFLLKNWSVVDFTQSKFDRVFAGHFHCYQKVGNNVWYPGSPIPFRFDEGVVDHGFIIYNTINKEVEFVKTNDVAKSLNMTYRAPDYLTIVDEDLPGWINMVTGNHVRIQLTRDYTANELANIRAAVKDKKGALSVHWLIPKKEIDEVAILQNQFSSGAPEATFDSWLTKDEPEDYNVELLKKLFEQVKIEAEERIVVEEDASEE